MKYVLLLDVLVLTVLVLMQGGRSEPLSVNKKLDLYRVKKSRGSDRMLSILTVVTGSILFIGVFVMSVVLK